MELSGVPVRVQGIVIPSSYSSIQTFLNKEWRSSSLLASVSDLPASRSMTQRTSSTMAFRFLSSVVERIRCPPDVTTSTMLSSRLSAISPLSASFQVRYSFTFFLKKRADKPLTYDSIATTGRPPISKPARISMPSGINVLLLTAISLRGCCCPSKKYLSMYSLLI